MTIIIIFGGKFFEVGEFLSKIAKEIIKDIKIIIPIDKDCLVNFLIISYILYKIVFLGILIDT